MLRFFLILALLAPPAVHADETVVAILDLKFIEDTGDPASVLCLGDDEESCVQWASLYLFEARVRKTISGELPRGPFRVLGGRHALIKKNLRGVIAILTKLEAGEPEAPRYQILRWGSKMELYCFEPPPKRQSEAELDVDLEGTQLSCYDSE